MSENIKDQGTLLKKVWDIADILAAAGVGFTDYITQLTYLLFLKMDSEKQQYGFESSVPVGCRWDDLKREKGEDLIDVYETVLRQLSEEDGIIGTIFTKASNKIQTPVHLKKVIEMLDGEKFDLAIPQELFERYYAGNPQFRFAGDTPEITIRSTHSGHVLRLVPRRYALGIGCRRGASADSIDALSSRILKERNLCWEAIAVVASAELKREEPGLLAFAQSRRLALRFFRADELNAVDVPNPSAAALAHLGIRSVSEAAALLAAGPGSRLVVEKTAAECVTVALAEVLNG